MHTRVGTHAGFCTLPTLVLAILSLSPPCWLPAGPVRCYSPRPLPFPNTSVETFLKDSNRNICTEIEKSLLQRAFVITASRLEVSGERVGLESVFLCPAPARLREAP